NGDLGLYLVAADAEGLTRVAHRQADGLGSANLKLENTPGQRLDAADAREVLTEVIDLGNAAIMAEAVGALEASLTMTAEYLKTREQFGAPIGVNQALQHRAADLYAELEYARSMALYSRLAVTSEAVGAEKDRHRDVIAAKVVVDQAARNISQESIQMHGGIGMTMEYPIGHYAKRLTVMTRTFDDADSLTAALAELGGLIEPHAHALSWGARPRDQVGRQPTRAHAARSAEAARYCSRRLGASSCPRMWRPPRTGSVDSRVSCGWIHREIPPPIVVDPPA